MSLKGDKYETSEEVRFRLEGTVVLYDGDPVYISRVRVPEGENEIARVYYHELPLKRPGFGNEDLEGQAGGIRKYLSSKKFDLAPFKMGYMNYQGNAVFVSRTPVRQNKQGLAQHNTVFNDTRGRATDLLTFSRMIKCQEFVDMIKGKYPSFKEVGELLGKDDVSSVAISRSFAFLIDHDLEALVLIHKGTKCGIALKDDKGLKIPEKYKFLCEEMEDHLIPLL